VTRSISVRRNPKDVWYGVRDISMAMGQWQCVREGSYTGHTYTGGSLPWAGRTAGINLGLGRRSINHPPVEKENQDTGCAKLRRWMDSEWHARSFFS